MSSLQLYWVAYVGVIVAWFAFAAVFLLEKKPPKPPAQRKESVSLVGIGLQGLAYGSAWFVRRPFGEPIVPLPRVLEVLLVAVTLLIAAISIWMIMAAMRTLGKQWSFQARIVEGHRLVTEGPYGVVRNPIYTGMLGMLVATALANSHWIGLLGAVAVFMIGAVIRVRSEEKLLRAAFGAEFDAYARRVPAMIPGLW